MGFPVMLLAAALATQAAPASPQPAAAAPAAARTVSIPFEPPLGRPLHYRSTVVTNRRGPTVTAWTDYEVSFTRRPAGFRMHVRATDLGSSITPAAGRDEFRRTLLAGNPPYVLLLDADGQIEEMENADAYWQNLIRTINRLTAVASEAPGDAIARATANDLLRETTPQGRLNLLTQHISPILDHAGASYVLGETLEIEAPVEGMMGLVLNVRMRLSPERIENGRLLISVSGSVPEAEMRRVTAELFGRLPVTGLNTEAERARTQARLRDARIERSIEGDLEIALDTGLARRFRSTDQMVVASDGETRSTSETLRIERID